MCKINKQKKNRSPAEVAHKGKILTVLDTLATTYNDIYPTIVLHWERRKHAQSNFPFYLQINLTDVYFWNFQQQLSNNEILLSGQYYGMIPSFPWEAFHDLQLNIGLHEFESWNYIAKVASNCIDINLVIRKPEETLFYSLLHSFKVSRFLLFFFFFTFPSSKKPESIDVYAIMWTSVWNIVENQRGN